MQRREEWTLDTHRIGRRVLIFDRVDSTNTVAAGFAVDPANDGLAILADEQTAGRGRLGRSWQCLPGSGVLLSVLLFPPPALCRPALLTAWAAVSVCETISKLTNLQAQLKWPNDVLIDGRKVGGILIEQRGSATICGIGLNVSQPPNYFAEANLPQAASLALFTDAVSSRGDMTKNLLRQLDGQYDRLLHDDTATLQALWKKRLGLLGKQVTVACADDSYQGWLRDLSWDAVVLEQGDGRLLRLRPEAIQQLTG